MNCEKCPHMMEIKSALRPCQSCEAGKLHGEVHIDQAALDYAPRAVRVDNADCVTALPPDVEDAVRRMFADIFQLSPLQMLLIHHVYNGGTYSNFRRTLRDIVVHVIDRDYDVSERSQSFRSICQQWGSKISGISPQFAAVMRRGMK